MFRNNSLRFDEKLETAYKQAIYQIFNPPIQWQVDVPSPALDAFLTQQGVTTAIFITASNPYSQILEDNENIARNTDLADWLQAAQYRFFAGQGEDINQDWPAEPSFLVLDIDLNKGRTLGQKFQQNAILYLERGKSPTLVWC